jgi:trans-aconitate methyltransferase
MTSREPRYTTDLIYPSAFVFGQTPVFMQWAAAAASAPRDLASAPFTYCDLGCGDGISLNVLAAEYPAATFIGVDLNPEHLTLARRLAERAGLANVTFRQASFEELSGAELPPMDFIAVHGVYSWIDETARDALHAFLRSHLKPGGLLCLQYSALPGSTIHDPLYNYLKLFADRSAGGSVQRFTAGFDELQKLRPHAAFFRAMPTAGDLLDSFSSHPLGLLAHEVLNRSRHSFYCHEVHDAMAELGLAYMGSGDLKLNHPELLMSRDAFVRFEEVTRGGDRHLRLAALDLVLNTATHVDVFRRPDGESGAGARRSDLRGVEDLHLRRISAGSSLDARRRASATVAVDLASPPHSAVLEAVGTGDRTIGDTLAAPALQEFDRGAVEKALAELVMVRALNMMIAPASKLEYRVDRRYRITSPINSIMLDETIHVPKAVAFASPVLGSALLIPIDARLRLMAWLGRDLERVWRILETQNRRMTDSRGQRVASFGRFREEIEAAVPQFAANLVPDLLRFGVLEEQP